MYCTTSATSTVGERFTLGGLRSLCSFDTIGLFEKGLGNEGVYLYTDLLLGLTTAMRYNKTSIGEGKVESRLRERIHLSLIDRYLPGFHVLYGRFPELSLPRVPCSSHLSHCFWLR